MDLHGTQNTDSDEPTRGVDIGAKKEIYSIIKPAGRKRGCHYHGVL